MYQDSRRINYHQSNSTNTILMFCKFGVISAHLLLQAKKPHQISVTEIRKHRTNKETFIQDFSNISIPTLNQYQEKPKTTGKVIE